MNEEVKISEVAEEVKNASEDELREVIEKWLENVRTQGLKIGAKFISAAIYGIIEKHLKKKAKPSLRDYQRCVDEIIKIIAVQITQQNDSDDTMEENNNDATAE